MKKCECFGTASDIVTWEVPGDHYGDKARLLHICTRCGHTGWADIGHSSKEDQGFPSSDDSMA